MCEYAPNLKEWLAASQCKMSPHRHQPRVLRVGVWDGVAAGMECGKQERWMVWGIAVGVDIGAVASLVVVADAVVVGVHWQWHLPAKPALGQEHCRWCPSTLPLMPQTCLRTDLMPRETHSNEKRDILKRRVKFSNSFPQKKST